MRKIEKYWNDITVYFVEFTSLDKEGTRREHRKMLAFKSGLSEYEVVELIKQNLSSSIDIKSVDEFADGLVLK